MKYKLMANKEINKAVAKLKDVFHSEFETNVYGAVKHDDPDVLSVVGIVDYCNNPSDAWPIIEEIWDVLHSTSKHHLNLGLGTFTTYIWKNHMKDYECNALKAAMIVYLKINEK